MECEEHGPLHPRRARAGSRDRPIRCAPRSDRQESRAHNRQRIRQAPLMMPKSRTIDLERLHFGHNTLELKSLGI